MRNNGWASIEDGGTPGAREQRPEVGVGINTSPEVHALLAGFVVCLAHRPLPAVQRRQYHRAVEQYLRWAASHSTVGDRSWRYEVWLREAGVSGTQLRATRDALGLLEEICRPDARRRGPGLPERRRERSSCNRVPW